MKKGFTLIELLAVIVILAIIALIAIPTITGIIEKTKKGAAEQSANGYIDGVEKQKAINLLDSNSSNDIDDDIYDVPMTSYYSINIKGQNPKKGWIEVTKNGIYRYSMVIGDYVVSYDGDVKTVIKGTEPNPKPTVNTIIYRFSSDELQNGDKIDLNNRKYIKYTKNDDVPRDISGIYSTDLNDVLTITTDFNGMPIESRSNSIYIKHTVNASGVITKSESCLKTSWGTFCLTGGEGIFDDISTWNDQNYEAKKNNLLSFFKWNMANNTSEYNGVSCNGDSNNFACNYSSFNIGLSSTGTTFAFDGAVSCESLLDVTRCLGD